MDQLLPSGGTLRNAISARLSRYAYPPNMQGLAADLSAIRDLIKDTARFTEAQQTEVQHALASFDPNQKIRFRSSSNAEDTQTLRRRALRQLQRLPGG